MSTVATSEITELTKAVHELREARLAAKAPGLAYTNYWKVADRIHECELKVLTIASGNT